MMKRHLRGLPERSHYVLVQRTIKDGDLIQLALQLAPNSIGWCPVLGRWESLCIVFRGAIIGATVDDYLALIGTCNDGDVVPIICIADFASHILDCSESNCQCSLT